MSSNYKNLLLGAAIGGFIGFGELGTIQGACKGIGIGLIGGVVFTVFLMFLEDIS